MATRTSAQHIGSVAAGDLKAEPGVDVTLQCNSPTDAAVSKLVWKKSGLENGNVFFFRDNRSNENNHDPRYRGRVELKDPEMKNGDVSVVLKNVDYDDSGTYHCEVITSSSQPEQSINLIVIKDSGEMRVEHGEDVLLQCNVPTGAPITKLKWDRPDQDDRSVFFLRDNKPYESYQDQRYHGRVELKDPQMKNGDASVLLKSVTVNDTGTYQCWVTPPNKQKDLLRSIYLIVSENFPEVKAGHGEDVTLQCNTSTDAAVTKLEWRRTGLKDDYVLYFRDNRANESFQDPRYRGRVELKDPEMKNGDASVLLKNVSIKDTGTYQCLVLTSPQKTNAGEPLVASIQLSVYTFEVKAGPGGDVTLQCNGPTDAAVTKLE